MNWINVFQFVCLGIQLFCLGVSIYYGCSSVKRWKKAGKALEEANIFRMSSLLALKVAFLNIDKNTEENE